LSPFAVDGVALIERANTLVNIRHTVIHGVLSDYAPGTHTVTLVKLDAKGTLHRQERETLTFEEMLSAGDSCHQLGTDVIAFTKRLLQALMPEDRLDDALGDL
jgi:hypothetical protein